jgi:hypothetical protein
VGSKNEESGDTIRQPEQGSLSNLLPDALVIAILTVAAYWLTFCYEASYLSSFGIPAYLVEVSLQTALLVATLLLGVFGLMLVMITLIAPYWPQHTTLQNKTIRVGVGANYRTVAGSQLWLHDCCMVHVVFGCCIRDA